MFFVVVHAVTFLLATFSVTSELCTTENHESLKWFGDIMHCESSHNVSRNLKLLSKPYVYVEWCRKIKINIE